MPARKPSTLVVRHDTKSDKMARESDENAMLSNRGLPQEAPARLKGHPAAAKAWRWLMREYGSIDGVIVTRLDQDLLIDYCILIEQTAELDRMRKMAMNLFDRLSKEYYKLIESDMAADALVLADKITSSFEGIVKIDSRVDRKRALMLQLRQSLYLTPRARAGVAPKTKDPEESPDDMETLLNEVTDYVNGGQGEK